MGSSGAEGPRGNTRAPLQIVPLADGGDGGRFGRRLGIAAILVVVVASVGVMFVLPGLTIATSVSVSGTLEPARGGLPEVCAPTESLVEGLERVTCTGRLLLPASALPDLGPGDAVQIGTARIEGTLHARIDQVEAAPMGAAAAGDLPVTVEFEVPQDAEVAAFLRDGGPVTVALPAQRAPASSVLRTWALGRLEAVR